MSIPNIHEWRFLRGTFSEHLAETQKCFCVGARGGGGTITREIGMVLVNE